MKTIFLAALICFTVSCSEENAESLGIYAGGGVCKPPAKSHQGCCSHHGGFTNIYDEYDSCETGEYLYSEGDRLVCSDGELSPTCTY